MEGVFETEENRIILGRRRARVRVVIPDVVDDENSRQTLSNGKRIL